MVGKAECEVGRLEGGSGDSTWLAGWGDNGKGGCPVPALLCLSDWSQDAGRSTEVQKGQAGVAVSVAKCKGFILYSINCTQC